MKYILIILLIITMVSCTKRYRITVLEVSIVQSEPKNLYKVSYKVNDLGESPYVTHDYFYTMLGVNNFLVEVADKDLSQWRVQ